MMLPLLPPGFLRIASIAYLQPHQTPLTLLQEDGAGRESQRVRRWGAEPVFGGFVGQRDGG